jgi:phytoene dehydrogenase-like protein
MNPGGGTFVDVVVVGGGHNGLAAAAYLGRAGYSVTVLEREPQVGGAAVSAQAFPGVDARLSRYSYLVSLMPQSIRDDLDLDISLIRRRYSSYTPVPGTAKGLLIDTGDAQRTRASFEDIGAGDDYTRWLDFYRDTQVLAASLFPTMTEPLLREAEVRRLLGLASPGRALYERFIETPITTLVNNTFENDIVRGVVLTDALIGTFPEADNDSAMRACFLLHVIGGGTGDWDVPVGGMGSVSGALENSARSAGVHIETEAEVTHISEQSEVRFVKDGVEQTIACRLVISGASRDTLYRLAGATVSWPAVEGAQVKVNMMLDRLPRLTNPGVSPEEAFGGTFHINESGSQLALSIAQAQSGSIPEVIPCEIYCHTLSDRSILGPELRDSPAHTLTVFALNVPHRLIEHLNPEKARAELEARVLASLNSVLGEPIEDCVMKDSAGNLCIETKTTLDLEHSLGLPGGNIFHQPLSVPFVSDDATLDTPAKRWGVDSGLPHVLLAGASAIRGGGVSAIGGHNAAMATLEVLRES